ncbi:YggS family pyridoxal phosphate-dependent enzyme [Stomatohabitans albus]|uniref:YggS family pyridoxal phosphate-dependent enzyme n=1 Tax=Stomatohabitans albus TaxID=3110766 RepID=UPI00300C18E1
MITPQVSPTDGQETLDRLALVYQHVQTAAEQAGRRMADITVVAVSKGVDAALVGTARLAGQLDFGEARARDLKARLDHPALARSRWHFIGQLQRNDVPKVVGNVAVIYSVDNPELGRAISDEALRKDRLQRCFIQVNIDRDPAKAGVEPDKAADLIARLRTYDGISIQGLTTVGSKQVDPHETYGRLRDLRDDLRARWPELIHLSMGMSNDYETAIANGATVLRVGRAIFGER